MVKYPEDANFMAPSLTGSQGPGQWPFTPWQPGTWPAAPSKFNQPFYETLKRIFQETMEDELQNVVDDVQRANSTSAFPLEHRGHVIAVAYMCALDALSAYGYKNKRRVAKFIRQHFPADYKPFANRIYPDYRLNLVHAWNLFGDAALSPGNEPIQEQDGRLSFGILNFVAAFRVALHDFLAKLETDGQLQAPALARYREVTQEFKPVKARQLSLSDVPIFMVSPTRFVIERFKDKVHDYNETILIWNRAFRFVMIASVIGLFFDKTGDAVTRHVPFYLGYLALWLFPFSRVNELVLAFYRDAFQRFTNPTTGTKITPVGRLRFLVFSYFEVAVQFGILYFCLLDGCFTKRFSSIIEAVYFSVVTITTVGYGDIAPTNPLSQLACMYELAAGFVLIIFALGSYLATSSD
jgi:voltage-gated potassium channel